VFSILQWHTEIEVDRENEELSIFHKSFEIHKYRQDFLQFVKFADIFFTDLSFCSFWIRKSWNSSKSFGKSSKIVIFSKIPNSKEFTVFVQFLIHKRKFLTRSQKIQSFSLFLFSFVFVLSKSNIQTFIFKQRKVEGQKTYQNKKNSITVVFKNNSVIQILDRFGFEVFFRFFQIFQNSRILPVWYGTVLFSWLNSEFIQTGWVVRVWFGVCVQLFKILVYFCIFWCWCCSSGKILFQLFFKFCNFLSNLLKMTSNSSDCLVQRWS